MASKTSSKKVPAAAHSSLSAPSLGHVPSSSDSRLMRLQRAIGNHSASRLVHAQDIGPAQDGIPRTVYEVLRSGRGQPLDPGTRASMESHFGEDLSSIRVHTDSTAADSASAVNADAYTVGGDIVFDRGRYSPSTSTGKMLLAHELAHTIQQSRGGPALASGRTETQEIAAETAASAIMSNESVVRVGGASGVGMARKPKNGSTTPFTPEELVKKVIEQRGFISSAPKVERTRGGETKVKHPRIIPSVDPEGIGNELGRGFDTNAAIQIVDRDGNIVAFETGAYLGRAQAHAEAGVHAEGQAIASLKARLGAKKFVGGRMDVAVDKEPCPACALQLRSFAEDLSLEKVNVYGPSRESLRNRGRTVGLKTAARTATKGTPRGVEKPAIRSELVYSEKLTEKLAETQVARPGTVPQDQEHAETKQIEPSAATAERQGKAERQTSGSEVKQPPKSVVGKATSGKAPVPPPGEALLSPSAGTTAKANVGGAAYLIYSAQVQSLMEKVGDEAEADLFGMSDLIASEQRKGNWVLVYGIIEISEKENLLGSTFVEPGDIPKFVALELRIGSTNEKARAARFSTLSRHSKGWPPEGKRRITSPEPWKVFSPSKGGEFEAAPELKEFLKQPSGLGGNYRIEKFWSIEGGSADPQDAEKYLLHRTLLIAVNGKSVDAFMATRSGEQFWMGRARFDAVKGEIKAWFETDDKYVIESTFQYFGGSSENLIETFRAGFAPNLDVSGTVNWKKS